MYNAAPSIQEVSEDPPRGAADTSRPKDVAFTPTYSNCVEAGSASVHVRTHY